ncbi:Hpt domain-containing protein [Coraliomargarita sp. SDUM461004]|uniref:Hpt domain-containing protein n=1 Tax=Thalassobacterium sedimentorum TaxID=3041258 RepID=A0ABU1AEB4_9BACT|nr:Hpt domain-containing protein [Coraliomargarita sp. SDUM461004]MDQ8193092.1 Hpt domain-containing protein [Coraliomargarita sp. SDUM461004]
MSEAPHLEHVNYDKNSQVLDREQVDMLFMCDEGEEDQELARELFGLFVSESEAKLAALSQVCAQGDRAHLSNIVHFIAGSAGNLGLARLAAFYRGVEHAIDDEKLTDISDIEPALRGEFELACDAFLTGYNL